MEKAVHLHLLQVFFRSLVLGLVCTSPHFVKFNERIVINGNQIEDEFVADFFSTHEKYIDEHQLTFLK